MGNKDRRQTKKERKVEAKRRRLEELKRAQRRARMRRAITLIVVLGAIGGIVAAVMAGGRSSRAELAELNQLAAAAGCGTAQSPEIEGSTHIQPPQTVNYGTTPPTSGNHYGSPGPTGVHTSPIQNEVQTHNLEHGHIAIQHNGADDAIVDRLESIVKGDDRWLILAPYPTLGTPKLAFTAWGEILTCDSPTNPDAVAKVAEAFVKRYKDSASESIPGTPNRA